MASEVLGPEELKREWNDLPEKSVVVNIPLGLEGFLLTH